MFALFKSSPSPLELIRGPLEHPVSHRPAIGLSAERLSLVKRRWRGCAADGREFGFDLERPLKHGDIFFETSTHIYTIVQTSEPVLRVELSSPDQAARIAWQIGNLHFPLMPGAGFLLVEDDIALRQMFEREHVHFSAISAVFQPFAGAAGHHHHHH
jgi:urease accessory protein